MLSVLLLRLKTGYRSSAYTRMGTDQQSDQGITPTKTIRRSRSADPGACGGDLGALAPWIPRVDGARDRSGSQSCCEPAPPPWGGLTPQIHPATKSAYGCIHHSKTHPRKGAQNSSPQPTRWRLLCWTVGSSPQALIGSPSGGSLGTR